MSLIFSCGLLNQSHYFVDIHYTGDLTLITIDNLGYQWQRKHKMLGWTQESKDQSP